MSPTPRPGFDPDELDPWEEAALDQDDARPRASVVTMADVQRERVTWLWPGYLPAGKLAVLDGDPGLGKSTITTDLAARFTTASPLPDGHRPDQPRAVLILTAEDGLSDTVRPRLEAAGAGLELVHVIDHVDAVDDEGRPIERPPCIPGDLSLIERVVADNDVSLVIIDPLVAFLGGSIDTHRDQDVRRALLPLAKMAERTCAAVLVLRHLNKGGGTSAIYRGGGSIGIIGAVRLGMLVAPDPDDDSRRELAVSKSNLAAHPPSIAYRLVGDEEFGCARIRWEGTTEHKADDLLLPREADDSDSTGATGVLAAILGEGAVLAREARSSAREAGVADRTLDRAKKKLRVVAFREGFGKDGKWYWRLPDTPKDATEAIERLPVGMTLNGESGDL